MLPSCLLLSALVHIWLALMIGTQPGPTVPGQGGWGDLTVTLRGPIEPKAEGEAVAQAWRDDGPLGAAQSPRHGGRLRLEAPAPDSGPGAQRLGRWKALELPPDPSRPEEEDAQGNQGQGVPKLDGLAVDSVAPPATPAAPAPAPAPPTLDARAAEAAPALRALEAIAAPAAQVALEAGLRPAPAQIDLLPSEPEPRLLEAPPLPRAVVARESLAAPRTQALPDRLTPVPREAPEPDPTLRTLDAPPSARPSVARERLAAPRTQALPDRLAPVPSEAPAPAPTLRTLEAPASPTRPLATREPLTAASPATGQVERLSPVPQTAPESLPAASPDPLTRGDPLADPVPGLRAAPGSPDAGARVGHDVATAPSARASAPLPPLNLSLPRGGPLAVQRGPGLLQLLPGLPERKTKLEKAVDEASRDDCRKAHSDKGLLAAGPLLLDALRNKGCKW